MNISIPPVSPVIVLFASQLNADVHLPKIPAPSESKQYLQSINNKQSEWTMSLLFVHHILAQMNESRIVFAENTFQGFIIEGILTNK